MKRTCEHCGEQRDDVKFLINPYIEDINGKEVLEWICMDCYNDLRDSI